MAEFHGDDLTITNMNNLEVGNETTPIYSEEIPNIISTLLQNDEVGLDEDTLNRIDGLDRDGLLSILLAASQSLVLMQEQTDEPEDTEDLYELGVRLYMASTGHSEWKVRQELSADPEALSKAFDMARVATTLVGGEDTTLEDEFAEDVLTYEQRWNPDRTKDWTTNGSHGRFVFREGIWFHERMGRSVVYPHLHFGFLDEGYFPMLKG